MQVPISCCVEMKKNVNTLPGFMYIVLFVFSVRKPFTQYPFKAISFKHIYILFTVLNQSSDQVFLSHHQ